MESGAGRRSVLTKSTTWAIWAETIKLDPDYTHFESYAAVKIWYYQLFPWRRKQYLPIIYLTLSLASVWFMTKNSAISVL